MPWSTEQIHQIVEQFWQNGAAVCPEDNGPVKIKMHKLLGGDYDLLAECLVCGKGKTLRRGDDPRRHQFRLWTSEEIQRLRQTRTADGDAACPVCEATVEAHPAPAILIPALIRCFRCGNSDQWHQSAPPTDPRLSSAPG